ncbi:MAG: OsmC family protein [Gammaproteobacteria bacterium]|nr:OsmC family protein [Gammaproteobacteria bacterium]
MEACVKWVDGAQFLAESGSGHSLVIDGPPEGGGRNMGMRPMELLLLGTAGCTAYDVVSILQKSRQAITDCRVEVKAERADEVPKVFTHIHLHYVVSGKGLAQATVERAIQLTSEKYCSASIMLAKAVEITHDYEIVEVA